MNIVVVAAVASAVIFVGNGIFHLMLVFYVYDECRGYEILESESLMH
jgi:hypothetical protein